VRASATSHPFRDAALAFTLLTVIPLRVRWPDGERPDVAGYFPVVGVLLGAFGYTLLYAPVTLAVPFAGQALPHSLLIAALLITAWALLTRMLHWDGLADVADAYWGAHDHRRRLEIMGDSHVGAFGVTSLVLVALVQVAAVSVLITEGALLAIAVIPVLGRYAAVFGSWLGAPAKETGLGAAVAGRPRPASAIAAAGVLATTAALAWGAGTAALPAVVACVVIALGVPHVLASRFGGITGDVLGASVLLTETASLVVFALVW
jgi:adenosylcobinamide-GDP ribazoletransferase